MKVGRMAATDYNRVASRAVRRARDESGLNQDDFARALSDALGLKGRARLKQSTLSGWELGTRQVPAGALVAAADVAGLSVSRALGEPGADVSDLAARVARLEGVARVGPKSRAAARAVRASVPPRR